MEVIGLELRCEECGYEEKHEDEVMVINYGHDLKCPKCNHKYMIRFPFVTCFCGAKVYLQRGDTECDNCGQAYNAFGQTITHMGFTEEDY